MGVVDPIFRALLFRTMKGRESSDDLNIPKTVLEHPLEPIYATLFQLFANKEAFKDTSTLFNELMDSGK